MKPVKVDSGQDVAKVGCGDIELGQQFDFAAGERGSTCSLRVTVTKYSCSTWSETTPVPARRCSPMSQARAVAWPVLLCRPRRQ